MATPELVIPLEDDPQDPVPDEALDEREVQSIVQRQIEEALRWRDEYLDPVQAKATDYYRRRLYGDEREGRSKVVTSEVLEAVLKVMPSLMRVFFGSERVVEFKPRGPEDVDVAEQQTDYVNYVVAEDNPGFMTFYSVFKDALLRLFGVVKWWWDDATEVVGSEHTGLTPDQVNALASDPEITQLEVFEDPETGLSDVAVLRELKRGKVRIEAVPPEEFVFSPSARSIHDSRMVGHVRDVPADQLVAMGVPDDMIERSKGGGDADMSVENDLKAARRIDGDNRILREDEQGEATRPIRFAELYTRIDEDGDGIAELRKIQAVGEQADIFSDEIVDSVPFAYFAVDPEPHTLVGLDMADRVMDLQRIKSSILRGLLDSLSLTLNPATEIVEGEVNVKDLLNPEVGRLVRVRRPGQMREVMTPFVGKEALPVMQYLDSLKDDRVGVPDAAAGLDADALQSSTRTAVVATVEAARQQLELIARLLAETGMKDVFRGLLRLVVQHQDEPRMVRLRNNFVRVDPRHWDADKDVVVNVALGTGLVEEKMAMLAQIAAKQEQGLMNGVPFVGMSQYRNTLGRMVELAGFRNSDEFFRPFGPQEEQAWQQAMASQPKPPTPEEVVLQTETMKTQQRQQETIGKLQIEVAKLQLEREKIARELAIKQQDVDQKGTATAVDAAVEEARLEVERETSAIDALAKLSKTNVGE